MESMILYLVDRYLLSWKLQRLMVVAEEEMLNNERRLLKKIVKS